MTEYAREPCPWRIIDDCGGAFTMGLIGGSIFNMISGARHAPTGFSRRAMGGLIRMKERAPVLGGQFAAWGICFASFDCTFAHLRQKEDPWNSIMSGASAGAVMAARRGPKHMMGSALVGAVLLGLIEGLGIMMNRYAAQSFRPQDPREAPADPSALGPTPLHSECLSQTLEQQSRLNMVHTRWIGFLLLLSWCQVWGKVQEELYQHRVAKIDNTEVPLAQYKGQVLLIVNVASECGFTDGHYKQLQKVYYILGDSGVFEILAFPCNQFGNQEPKSNSKIWEFATKKYGVTFPMFAKVLVTGADAHPFWQYIKGVTGVAPNWNFYKYLVDHEGTLVHIFGPDVSVEDTFDQIQGLVDQAKAAKKISDESPKSEL
eukprot:TCALIF_12750-PA protein Name:"Similar to Timm17b Mitochondrial import inner membrane translocase subunit Tim17-B (Mus musculus)" AED:0.11 eAED:0.11 QI:132/0.8/0.66/1/0.8/0.83/6/234/373